jgi:hypothetical protein
MAGPMSGQSRTHAGVENARIHHATGRHTRLQKHTKPVSRHRWILLMEPSTDAAFQIPENHDGRGGRVGHSPLLEKYIFAMVWKE